MRGLLTALVRGPLRAGLAVAMLLAIAAPASFGPSLGRVLHALGAESHVCRCGMKPGTCGCPACARLEKQRLDDDRPYPVPALRRACDDPTPGFASGPLGAAVLPEVGTLPPVAPGVGSPSLALALRPDQPLSDPPTPPPRIATS